jgi:hypothetical protein
VGGFIRLLWPGRVLDPGPEAFGDLASTIAILRGLAEMVACAEMRLMSAVASLDKQEGAQ